MGLDNIGDNIQIFKNFIFSLDALEYLKNIYTSIFSKRYLIFVQLLLLEGGNGNTNGFFSWLTAQKISKFCIQLYES